MLFLALAFLPAVATRPEPQGNQAQWVQASDIPSAEWSRATLTSYDLILDETGHLLRCDITHSSGSQTLDDAVCASLMRRARYKPALDASGMALPSAVRDHVQWNPGGSGDNKAMPEAPDVVIRLDKAVLKRKSALVQVIEIIDSSGKVESCAAEQGYADDDLSKAACSVVGRPEISTAVRNEAGVPVRGVRAFNVGFLAGPAASITIR